nr:TPA_asm: movement protein [Phalaenopsis ophiovirus]
MERHCNTLEYYNDESSSNNRSLTSYKMASFRRANDHLLNDGAHTIVSLGGEGDINGDVEDMAAEFANVTRGEIESIVSPFSLKLKDGQGSQKVELTTLQKITSSLKNIGGKEYPFCRIDKVKILYMPLFDRRIAEGKIIRFSLKDNSVIENNKQVISRVDLPLNVMSMSEMSMSFFTKMKEIENITLNYTAEEIPVRGRSYAFVMVAFYIHRDFAPASMKIRAPLTLLLNEIDAPIDINKTSSIKKLVDKVNTDIRNKKERFEQRKHDYFRMKELRNNDIYIDAPNKNDIEQLLEEDIEKLEEERDASPNDDVEIKYNEAKVRKHFRKKSEDSESTIENFTPPKTITEKEIHNHLPRDLPYMLKDNHILDSGAPQHHLYNPNFIGGSHVSESESSMFKSVRQVILPWPVEVKLGRHWTKLNDVLYCSARHQPLISFNQLVKDKIVDCLRSLDNEKSILLKDERVIYTLSKKGGYLVFDNNDDTSQVVLG